MNNKILISILIVILFTINKISAQNYGSLTTTTTSSYSYFGLGEDLYKGTAENMGKGGLGTAVINNFSPTFNNSASFFHNKLATFQIGVKLNEKQQQTTTINNWSNVGYLSYATLAFPIAKWWGSGIGIVPQYGQGYDVKNDSVATPYGNATYQYTGKGGVNKLVWSNGINPFKWFNDTLCENFSVGVGLAYLFGRTQKFDRIIYDNNVKLGLYNQIITNANVYSGFQFNYGLLHKFKIYKNLSATLGANYEMNNKIVAESVNYIANYIEADSAKTISNFDDANKSITLPSKYSIGATFHYKEKLNIGVEYKQCNWSKYKVDVQKNNLIDGKTYIFGAEYVKTTSNNITKNTYYRMGLRYSQNPYKINGNAINEKAISFGYSQPIETNKTYHVFSNINVSVEFMQRGSKTKNLLENFFSAYVGLTINDKWFVSQKYD